MHSKHILIGLVLLSVLSGKAYGVTYPPNLDYGQQGDFIAKRATENGRATVIMPIGPVLVTQPELPGSSSAGLDDRFHLITEHYDLSDLTNPTALSVGDCEQLPRGGCRSLAPIHTHGTVIRFDDQQARLLEPGNNAELWRAFDPNGATLLERLIKVDANDHINPWSSYSILTSPHIITDYWSYNNPPDTYVIRDETTNEILTQWNHLEKTGVSGFPITLGNLLVYASDQQQTGLAIYNMTGYKQGQKPILLSKFNQVVNKPEPNNGIDERLGGYWVADYGTNRAVFAARRVTNPVKREMPALFIVNFDDPANPYVSCEVFFNQDALDPSDGDDSSDPMYVFFQDEYAYVDHFKVNIPACEAAYIDDQQIDEAEFHDVVYRFNDVGHHCDGSQYFRPLGQVGVFGGYDFYRTQYIIEYSGAKLDENKYILPNRDEGNQRAGGFIFTHYSDSGAGHHRASWDTDGLQPGDTLLQGGIQRTVVSVTRDEAVNEQGLCFMVTQDEPDTRPPFVAGHLPKSNASAVPIDTFISIHIPETLRSESLVGAFQVVNDNTGAVVASKKQLSQTGTVSIWPDDYLDTYTTYTVTISGVQDFMGNTMNDYSFQFTTGGDIVVTLPPLDDDEVAPTFGTLDFPGTPYYVNQSGQLSCQSESSVYNLWAVNPDNGHITAIDTALDNDSALVLSDQKNIFAGYQTPTSITYVDRYYAVTFRDDDRVVFFDEESLTASFSIYTGYGTQPISSLADASKANLYVALYGSGELLQLDLKDLSQKIVAEKARLQLGVKPKAMAMFGDRLLVSRYISAKDYGEVYDVSVSTMTLTNTIRVNKVTVPDDIDKGSGVPNFLSSIAISSDGNTAYVAAIKANTDNPDLDDDNTVRPMMVVLDLVAGEDKTSLDPSDPENTIDFDNQADPTGVIFLVDGTTRITSMQGNNVVLSNNLANGSFGKFVTGGAPQTMCATERILYVKNFTDRSISAIDVAEHMYDGRGNPDILTIQTVASELELLSSNELNGLKTFYHSSMPEMGPEGYISCASCHADGGQDGQVWDMTKFGEGLRNTLSLNGTSGTRFGNLHWSQNFDEVEDFEIQIEQLNGGSGLLAFKFGENDTPLNVMTALQPDSAVLNDLAAYISSLGKQTVKRSPYRDRLTGELTSMALSGQAKFAEYGCMSCHSGKAFRDGLAHDVGTIDPADNQAYGQPGGFTAVRTPTLVDLWETPPYFHNGSADTLADVFNQGGVHTVSLEDREEVIEFLNSIDREMFIEDDAPFPEQ